MQHRLDLNVIANARKYGSEWDKNDGLDISSGKYSSTQHYGFMRFGEINIPSYAIIVSATLRFYVSTKQSGSGYTHYAYPVQDNGTSPYIFYLDTLMAKMENANVCSSDQFNIVLRDFWGRFLEIDEHSAKMVYEELAPMYPRCIIDYYAGYMSRIREYCGSHTDCADEG